MPLRRIAALALLGLSSACVTHVGAPLALRDPGAAHDYTIVRDVTYTPANWPQALQADLWLPRGLGPFATVLVIHGGGWQRGERADMDGIARALARRGFAAVVASYRLAPAHRFPAAVHDLQQALRWVRAQAALYRFDPQRIGAYGYSAGGHLAALLGVLSEQDVLDSPHGGAEARVRAVVAGAAPFDLARYEDSPLIEDWLGAGPEEDPALYALASPITHVSAGDAPMFIYQGSWDALVPLEMSQAMKAALDVVQVPAELFLVTGHGHFTLFLLNDDAVAAAIDFLDRRLR